MRANEEWECDKRKSDKKNVEIGWGDSKWRGRE